MERKIIFTRIAIRNIYRSRVRSILTLIGIAGSIALYVTLTSISNDLKYQLDHTVANNNIDVIVQEKGTSTPVSSSIEMQSIRDIERLETVKSAYPVSVGSIRTNGVPYMFLFGIPLNENDNSITKLIENGLIEGTMFQSGKNEIILGRLAAKRINKQLGATIVLGRNQEYIVSGIYWVGQGILDGGAMVDISRSQDILQQKGYANMAMIEGYNKNETAQLIRDIKNNFPNMSATPANSLRSQISAFNLIDGFVNAISTIALLLSGVLILNTLLMAVSERTREIGVLMAIGWSRLMIIKMIISEALLLGFIGGIIGYGVAFPALHLIKYLPAMVPGWIPNAPTLGQIVASVGLACGIAFISSLYPALFATRLLPASALKHE